MKRFLSLWLPVIIWGSFIFYLSSIPNLKAAQNPSLDEILRSGIHFIFYLVFYFLFFRALNFQKPKKDYLYPLALTFFYAFSDEFHQFFVPTRTFQIQDLIVDWSGAALGGLILWCKKS